MSKKNYFPEYGSNYSFSKFEETILDYWAKNKVFEQSLDSSKYTKEFMFYDGPPFATGLPHYGHLLAGTIKDIVPRYWTMRGYKVDRKFGWDTHGLPVEFEMEKKLKLNGSLEIIDYGIGEFNEQCRGIVLRYASEWRKTVERMGRWVDMENDYKTMDPDFMESVWWVFKQLFDKGLIYEGKKVVPYSWRLTAPLSNFEASLNYKSVQDPSVVVLLPIKKSKSKLLNSKTALSIWTTTPWTLPSNLAVSVHPNNKKIQYGLYKLPEIMGEVESVVMAKSLAEKYQLTDLIADIDNSELIGTEYIPPFDLFESSRSSGAFKVISADYVSAEDGTGLVHQAPAFGEDDFYACQKAGIELVDPTDESASFTDVVLKCNDLKEINGLFVKDADKLIVKKLKQKNILFHQAVLQHNYPFCERSETPLIYKAIPSWFVNVEVLKEKMLAHNQEISWVPEHIKDGRFGKWLENARDWCISRNRFWGTPIPVWRNTKTGDLKVIGSIEELEDFAGKKVPDIHKHFVDDIKPLDKNGQTYERVPQVLDCWFESGSMPYAQRHYPFENKEAFEKSFPADFIAEGLDQTRGWFYTLTILSTALFDKPAFKNCIVNGMILAEDGKKMSKRLKNYPDPKDIISKYGADSIRLYLMQSPAIQGDELRFSEENLVQIMRAIMIPLWNAYSFFASYGNIDGWSPEKLSLNQSSDKSDQWILARIKEVEINVHTSMNNYKLFEVAPHIVSFIDDLTNWYIRLNRSRFWGENNEQSLSDKNIAYSTLYIIFTKLVKLLAPCLPFFAEYLNAALNGHNLSSLQDYKNSVHLELYDSTADLKLAKSEEDILGEFQIAKNIILLGRALRGEAKIGLRQPLNKLTVAGLTDTQVVYLNKVKDLILSELNIKDVQLVEKASDLVEISAKPNFKTLGPRAGKQIKEIAKLLSSWNSKDVDDFEKNNPITLAGVELELQDVLIVRKAQKGKFALSDFGLVAELDTTLTDSLIEEGVKRELINRIQKLRKEKDFHLADRINVAWNSTPNTLVERVLEQESKNLDLIAKETLTTKFSKDLDLNSNEQLIGDHGKVFFELQVS